MSDNNKLSRADFAAIIKSKYPQYDGVDNDVLVDKIIEKYPEYQDKVLSKKKEEPTADLSTSSEVSDSGTPSTEPKKTLSTEDAVNLIQKEEGKSLWESFTEVATKTAATISGALDWGGTGVGEAAASNILEEYATKEDEVVAARKKVEEEAFKAPEQTIATHQADMDRLSLLDDYLAHPKSPKYLSKDSEFSSREYKDVKAERDELSIKVSPFVAPIQKIKDAQWLDNNAVESPYGAREDVSTGEVTEVEEPSIALYKQYLREENPTALSDFETAQKEADKDVATSQRSVFMQKANHWYRETLSNSLSIKGEKTITSPDGQQTSVKDVIKSIEEASTELEKINEAASAIDDKIKNLIEESKDSVTNGEINTEILNKINAEVSDYANSLFSKVEEEAKNATTQEDIDLLNARYKSDVDAFGVATTDRHLSGFYDIQKKVALLNSQRAKIVEESQSKFSSINTAMSLDEIKDYQNTVSLQGVVAKSTEELLQFDPTALKQHQEREFLQDALDKEAKEGQLNWNDKAVRWFSGHAVQLAINLATIPRSFSAGGDYDWGEYVGDFVEHILEPATLTSTDLQRGLYERVVNIDGYKLTLDDEKNVIGVRDKDGFAVKGVEAKSIVSKYMGIPKSQRPKEESEFASDLLFRKSADTMLTMAELVYGGQFATKGLQYMGKLAKAAKATEKASKFIGLTASGFVFEHNGLYNEALEAGLNKNEASNLALVGASAVAMLENISPGEKIFSKAARRELVGEYMKYLGRGATRRDAIAYGVKAVVKEIENENLQEISQTIADRVVKMGANSIVGENTFDTKITWEELKETALLTTISSGLLAVKTQGTTISPSWLETSALYTAATEKDQSKLFDRVDLMIENGQLTQSEGDNAKETIIEARDAYSKIPEGRFSGEKENELFSLLLQRGRIEKLNEEVDPVFRKQGEALIEDINKDIEEVINREEGVEPKKEADRVVINPETSSNYANLTEDADGNFVFFHRGDKGYESIKPSTRGTTATSREEGAAISKVGGVAMYYTDKNDAETSTSGREAQYAVVVPKDKVYDFNTDALNLIERARELHEQENPGKAFDANSQVAYVGKVAKELGYEMIVAQWDGKTRAQSLSELTPSDVSEMDGNTVVKKFEKEYTSNKDKGYESVIPKTKSESLQEVYDKIHKERNKAERYDSLYKLYYTSGEHTQEEITKLVNDSDISQELKDEYNEALAKEYEGRSSKKLEVGEDGQPKTTPEIVKNAPAGAYVNVGLMEGTSDKRMSTETVVEALPDDVKVVESLEIEKGDKVTEPTLLMKLSRPLTDAEMTSLRERLKQEAIPQLSEKKGSMYGTLEWGKFDPAQFIMPNGERLSDVKAEAEVTGEEAERLDRIKKAAQSRILSSSRFGKKGVKALNRLVERLNRAFPNVEVSLDTSQLPVRIKKDFKDGAKGAVWAGKVYINPDTATLDTPIHEFGHIFMLWAKKNSKPLHKKGIELIKGSAYEARVRENKNYKGLSEDAILEEALALAIGEKGAMLEDTEVLKTKNGAWRSDKFKKWLNKLLNVFNKKTEIDPNMTLGEYTDMVAGALLSGKKISDVTTDDIAKIEKSAMFSKADDFKASQESIDSIEEVRNADGKLLAPNGEVSNLSEKNWKLVRTPEFKSWFGNWEKANIKTEDVTLGDRAKNEKLESDSSVVVDSNGEPQVVYHGSPTIDIKEFDRSKSQKNSGLREHGMFFTDNMDVAEVYSSKRQMTMEAMAEIDAKVKDLKEEQLKTKNNQEYNNIEREIIRFESLLGQIYPVFLNIRTAHRFDAEGNTFGDDAYLKMDVGLGYKVASGAPAMEALAGKNSKTRGTTKVDGVVAENIVDLSEVPDNDMDKYKGTTFVVFDEKTDAQIAPEFSKKERNIIDGAVIAMAYEGATELEISKILSEQGYTEEQVSRAYDRVYHVIMSNSIVSKNEPGENTVESGDVSIDTDSRGVLKKYMKPLVDFVSGKFRARGRMPKEGWAVMKEKDSRLYSEAAEIAKRKEFFESSLKHSLSLKYFGKPQTKLTAKERAKFSAFWLLKSKDNEMFEDYSDILKNVDLYLRGVKDKSSVGVELANVLDGMRGHVDRLSQYLIDTGVTQGDLALIIKENLGIYLTRTYQVYDDPNWNYETLINSPYGEKLINNAISYLRRNQHAEIIKQVRDEAVVQFQEGRRNSPELTIEEASEMVEERMRGIVSDILNKKEVNFLGVSSGLSVSDEKILKEQKNIDAPIRALMGEYSDPLYNYMMSAYKIANLVESKRVLTNMKEVGMGKFLWRKSDPSRPKTGTIKISADSSSKMAPLNGIYMEETAYKELEKVFKSNDEYSKLWWFFVGSIRAGKTILSPATHSKNVIGNIGFVLMNGHYDVASAVLKVYKEKGNLKDAISSVADGQKWNEASLFLLGISEPKTKEEMKAALDRSKRLASLGITGQSVGSRDLKEVGERAGFDFLLSKNISFDKLSSIKGIAKRGKSAATQGVGAAASLYQKEDDMFKIWAFEMERSRYEGALKKKGMSEQEIDEWVAERVKNTYPTYDRVGKIITQLKGLPFAGDFLPFKYESIRTFKNSIIYAVQDSKDPDLKKVGGKRIASMVSYWMMKESIGPLLGGLGGGLAYVIPSLFVGDDEEEILKSELSARMFMPSWDENQQIVNFKVNRDGKFEYTVFGASDPHGDMSSLLNQISILTLDEGFSDINQAKALAIALKDYFGSFLSLNIAFESATELVRIAQDSSMPRHRRNKAIKRVLRSISPGFITQTSDLINATDKSAKITQMATGVRVTEIDPKIYLTIAIKELGAHINDELWHYKNLEDRTSADYDESIGYLDDVVHDMESLYRAAINLGMKESDLDKMLDNYKVGLPKQVKRHIKTGRSSGKWFSRGGKK